VEEFKRLVIREENGAIVRLEDIAEVVLGAEDYDTEVRFPDRRRCSWASGPCPTPTRWM
jgi:multidrug efflux pump